MKFIISIFLLAFSLLTYGQETTNTERRTKFYLIFGESFILTPEFDNRLRSLGYQKPPLHFVNWGLGLKIGRKRLFGGFDGSVYFVDNQFNYFSNGFQFQGYVNYKIIDGGKISLSPGMDLGIQGVRAVVKTKTPANNFETLFLSSGNYVSLTNTTPVAGFSTIIHFKKYEESKNLFLQFISQIRIGYKFGLQNNPWRAHRSPVLNAPSERIGNLYFEMLVGF
jgi:hypothetical protein